MTNPLDRGNCTLSPSQVAGQSSSDGGRQGQSGNLGYRYVMRHCIKGSCQVYGHTHCTVRWFPLIHPGLSRNAAFCMACSLLMLVMDIFSVKLKFCHICCYSLYPCPSWSSAFKFILHQFLHPVLITYPYQLSLPLLITVVIGSTPTNFLNYSLVIRCFMETPPIHLIICISALASFNPTSASIRVWSHF